MNSESTDDNPQYSSNYFGLFSLSGELNTTLNTNFGNRISRLPTVLAEVLAGGWRTATRDAENGLLWYLLAAVPTKHLYLLSLI